MSSYQLPDVTVYPRWRGEHYSDLVTDYGPHGLSPLARGTQQFSQFIEFFLRFIPAGAGNTEQPRRDPHAIPVYPRWRGEHAAASIIATFWRGLSPLARGTPFHAQIIVFKARFIPAGAGNTPAAYLRSSASAVYPRWRGEHYRIV